MKEKIIAVAVFIVVILVGFALFFLPCGKWHVPPKKIAIIEIKGR